MFEEEEAGDNEKDYMLQTIRLPNRSETDAFPATSGVFTAPNAFSSWKHWRKIAMELHGIHNELVNEKLVGPYFLRAASLWRKIEQWCDDESKSGTLGQDIKSSLLPGKALGTDPAFAELDDYIRLVSEEQHDIEISAFEAVYAFYRGQCDPRAPVTRPQRFNPFTGLFGGFQAYHITSSSRWSEPEFGTIGNHPVISIAQGEMNVTLMMLKTGQVYFLSQGGRAQKLLATPVSGSNDQMKRMRKESILRWFEEHAYRLDRGFYSVGNIISTGTPQNGATLTLNSILRYPALADTTNCSR